MNKKTIVILDGYTLNPGDLSWDALKRIGDCSIYDRSNESEIVNRAEHAQIILTNKTPLSAETIKRLPHLELIVVMATGVNVVDIGAAKNQNIPVANVPAYGANSVAQMVFAHILNLTQHVNHHNKSVKNGRWVNSKDWCYWDSPLIELAGKKIGVIGFGKIGQKVASIAQTFEMEVLVITKSPIENLESGHNQVSLDILLEQSDFVSLHCPLTEETNQLINKESLSKMKKSAFLINTSRGALINEQDLADTLNENHIAGAGLDVLSTEPPKATNPLLGAKNCFITPHIAWATKEARQRLMNIVLKNVQSFLEGETLNIVN